MRLLLPAACLALVFIVGCGEKETIQPPSAAAKTSGLVLYRAQTVTDDCRLGPTKTVDKKQVKETLARCPGKLLVAEAKPDRYYILPAKPAINLTQSRTLTRLDYNDSRKLLIYLNRNGNRLLGGLAGDKYVIIIPRRDSIITGRLLAEGTVTGPGPLRVTANSSEDAQRFFSY